MIPAVSVVMPVRDGGAWLAGAVDSILGQTLADIELLVVDDHSREGAVARLPRDDARLHILPCRGEGMNAAFATGLAAARSPVIARMDGDDVALPERLERQLELLWQRPDIGIAGGCVEFFGEEDIGRGNLLYRDWLNSLLEPGDIRNSLFIESPIPNPTAMFRREVLERIGSYRDCGWPEDYDLFLRADAAGVLMAKPAEVLLRWREHPDRLTRTDPLYARENFQRAKAHYLVSGRLPDRPMLIWGAGPTGKRFHDLLRDEGLRIAAFADVHPRRIGGHKRGRPVLPPEAVPEGDWFVLVAVGARAARPRIRKFMAANDWREGRDYLFVA